MNLNVIQHHFVFTLYTHHTKNYVILACIREICGNAETNKTWCTVQQVNKTWHITQHGGYLQIFASETRATLEPWAQKVWGRCIGRKSIQDVQTNSWSGPERWESKLLESWPAVLAIRSLRPHYSRSPAVAHKLCVPYLDERDHKPLTSCYHRMESMTKKFT